MISGENKICLICFLFFDLLTARLARSTPFSLVAIPVSLEAVQQCEHSTTELAFVSGGRMRFAMVVKSFWASKAFRALVTFVRLGASVHVYVIRQVILLCKSFLADVALKIFHLTVHR